LWGAGEEVAVAVAVAVVVTSALRIKNANSSFEGSDGAGATTRGNWPKQISRKKMIIGVPIELPKLQTQRTPDESRRAS